jgi:hypothetical protein
MTVIDESKATGGLRASESEAADGGGPSIVSEEPHQIAANIARSFRDDGLGCVLVNFAPTKMSVLRRDRIVSLALGLLTALAWSHLLWLSADMSMGGMDMTDFQMIPSGMRLMAPADAPWQAMEFAFVFVMSTVMMVGMMTPSAMPMIFMYAASADTPSRSTHHLLQLSGSLPAISFYGAPSRCSLP